MTLNGMHYAITLMDWGPARGLGFQVRGGHEREALKHACQLLEGHHPPGGQAVDREVAEKSHVGPPMPYSGAAMRRRVVVAARCCCEVIDRRRAW
ncbi:hypothetical protein D3C71_1865820 [compost metagenome]